MKSPLGLTNAIFQKIFILPHGKERRDRVVELGLNIYTNQINIQGILGSGNSNSK